MQEIYNSGGLTFVKSYNISLPWQELLLLNPLNIDYLVLCFKITRHQSDFLADIT